MNNEPVAWMDEETGCFVYSQYDYEDLDEHGKDGLIPLYTHPAKTLTDDPLVNFKPVWQEKPELTLTDEEIEEVLYKLSMDSNLFDFARAILKKAQEK